MILGERKKKFDHFYRSKSFSKYTLRNDAACNLLSGSK